MEEIKRLTMELQHLQVWQSNVIGRMKYLIKEGLPKKSNNNTSIIQNEGFHKDKRPLIRPLKINW